MQYDLSNKGLHIIEYQLYADRPSFQLQYDTRISEVSCDVIGGRAEGMEARVGEGRVERRAPPPNSN
jgi:hypothetical protein